MDASRGGSLQDDRVTLATPKEKIFLN